MKKIAAFIGKLKLWERKMNDGASKEYFLTLQQFLASSGVNFIQDMKFSFKEHFITAYHLV